MINRGDVFWYTKKKPVLRKRLEENISADAVVIGGGVAGLSCAQRLCENGYNVVLVEKDFCGAGASGRSSGFITPDSEIELSSLTSNYGPEKAKHIWEFVCYGVEKIRANIENFKIACDYQIQDSFFAANKPAGTTHVLLEHAARRQLGYGSTLYKEDIIRVLGSPKYSAAVRYPDTFGINSYLYCQELGDVLEKKGVRIFENSEVTVIDEKGVTTSSGRVNAKEIIVCVDRFTPYFGVLDKEIYHVQTFLGISEPLTDEEIKRIFPENKLMVWDTSLVYNYFRVTGDNKLLIGGGDLLYTYAHNVATDVSRFKRKLEMYFAKNFPDISIRLEYVWPGMLGVSKDLLPIMGPDEHKKNVWYVGAASGLPWATALGVYAADRLIINRKEFDEDFSWRRKFIISPRLQSLLTTPVSYAISHGIAKYFK